MAHVPMKLFSVERRAQRLGTPLGAPVAPAPAAPLNGEILEELRALRADRIRRRSRSTTR
jgi:hypothetical protein